MPLPSQWVGYYTERNAGNAIKELEVSLVCSHCELMERLAAFGDSERRKSNYD